MYQAAEEMNFERAAHLRDSIKALKSLTEQQKVMYDKSINQDIIALVMRRRRAVLCPVINNQEW